MAPFRGTKLLSRWGYLRGRRVDARLVAELARNPDVKPRTAPGEWWLIGVSVLVVLLSLSCVLAVVGVWMQQGWPVGVRVVASLALLGLAAALLPAPLRVPKGTQLAEGQGVAFRQLVDDVAAAVGAEPPDVIVIDMSLNAAVARFGWRQRSVLVIGAPLWAILTPDARVSVLAHECGHLVNKDPMRSVLTLPARSFGERAVVATGGRNPWRRGLEGVDHAALAGGSTAGLGGLVVYGILALVNTLGATAQLLVDALAMPDSRRAELLADLLAREAGGSAAFIASSERLLMSAEIWQDLWDQAPRIAPTELSAVAERAAATQAHALVLMRQRSRRTSDLWSTHPAESDRMALIEALPEVEAALQIEPERWGRIDAEMSAWYARILRALLGTRDSGQLHHPRETMGP